ncbi:unnamed protein product [Gadus morhua 'NCC']
MTSLLHLCHRTPTHLETRGPGLCSRVLAGPGGSGSVSGPSGLQRPGFREAVPVKSTGLNGSPQDGHEASRTGTGAPTHRLAPPPPLFRSFFKNQSEAAALRRG